MMRVVGRGKAGGRVVASGGVAGLAAITLGCGVVGAMGALVMGAAAGVLCFLAATKMKRAFGYDDSLDVFGVHGIGGIIGALLTGVFAAASLGGVKTEFDMAAQLWIQLKGVLVTVGFSGIATFVILKVIDLVIGLRATPEQETEGLDLALHDERGYNI